MMPGRNKRVVLASEYRDTRSLISGIVERERNVEIVGEAHNAIGTLTLARNLRPDVVILDCYLPHSAGQEALRLSKMSGLDVAQAISEELPKTKVMVLNNLEPEGFSGGSASPAATGNYCVAVGGACVSLADWPNAAESDVSGSPIFATIAAREGADLEEGATATTDKIIFFGALGFAVGWLVTLTMILAPVGLGLVALGTLTALAGLTAKAVGGTWRRMKTKRDGA